MEKTPRKQKPSKRIPRGIVSAHPKPVDFLHLLQAMKTDRVLRKRVTEIVQRSLEGGRKNLVPIQTCLKIVVALRDRAFIKPLLTAFNKARGSTSIKGSILYPFEEAGFLDDIRVRQALIEFSKSPQESLTIKHFAHQILKRHEAKPKNNSFLCVFFEFNAWVFFLQVLKGNVNAFFGN